MLKLTLPAHHRDCTTGGACQATRAPARGVALLITGLVILTAAGAAMADQFARVYATNNKVSLTEWGRRYENGEGVPADVGRAIRLYCKAAAQGHADAQYYLGRVYSRDGQVKRDDALAAAWFGKAANQGHPQSRNLLRLIGVRPSGLATCPTGGGVEGVGTRGKITGPAPKLLSRMIRDLAYEFRLDPELVLAVVRVESNFNPNARSPKNAQGLMQLIPATAERFGVRNAWDPQQNLRGGMAYLRWLLDRFEGDVALALAGYNAGEGAVQQYRGVPPYAETRDYVRRVTDLLKSTSPHVDSDLNAEPRLGDNR